MLLEGGLWPIRVILKSQRVMYLQCILQKEDTALVKQIFQKQCEFSLRQDWVNTVSKDLEDLNLNLSFKDIADMSKYKFKKIVKEACQKFAFKYLIEQKNKLSKGKNLIYNNLKTQNYLKPGTGLSQDDIKQIYLLRTQNIMVKTNFPGMFQNDKCVSNQCSEKDSSRHVFYCKYLNDTNEKCLINKNIKYEDIYSNDIQMQVTVKNIFMKKYKQRQKVFSSS